MLNPDGVVVGNYRCSLAGRDLNRNYRTMLKNAFPCVWHTRNMVKRFGGSDTHSVSPALIGETKPKRVARLVCGDETPYVPHRLVAQTDVLLYCDFHGHSRKNNVFMYGCNDRDNASLQLHERVFPLMMSKNAKDKVRVCNVQSAKPIIRTPSRLSLIV